MALDPGIVAIVIAILSGCFILWREADVSLDPREPPIVRPALPFIGHILGMIRHQVGYFEILSRNAHPIFTLKIFNARIYVVQSPELLALTMRESKTLAFDPFTTLFLKNALGAPPSVVDVFENSSYLTELHTGMYSALAIGPGLRRSNARVLNALSRYLVPQETNLYAFLRESYTVASGETLYGRDNPVPDLIDDIWAFEEDLGLMMTGLSPRLIAPKAYRAQRRVARAFKQYYDAGLDANANDFVKNRAKVARDHHLDNAVLGIFEIAICFAPVTNVVPTVFWMLSYIYTDPDLLRALRDEVTVLGNPLDISKLHACPLLVSTFQETQRLQQHGNAVRFVTADTLLDGYLLKKGAIIQIPSAVLNTASSTWGPDAATFNPRRFLAFDDKKARQHGFIPFGGGRNLCPGRHLAFTEALGFVAAFVWGFEMEGVQMLQSRTHKMGFGARKPKGDLPVSIRPREGFENATWSFNTGDETDVVAK